MKKMVLTNAELGTYASSSGSVTMKYHDSSNVYATSKVKEFLEGTYINTLGANNLKEIDGYKIRLITVDELINNLGWKIGTDTAVTYDGNSVLDWVYKNMGEENNSFFGYWTMSPHETYSYHVWIVDKDAAYLRSWRVSYDNYYAVRPVINLLKTSIGN